MEKLYKVWADSESNVEVPMHEMEYFETFDEACDLACILAHEHDGKPYRAIFHVEDILEEETVETYENFQ
jgi:hypothetical protein